MARDIIVIGGSMGSGNVLRTLAPALPPDLPAAIFVVSHLPSNGSPYLVESLSHRSALPVVTATDGQPIVAGRIYVAPSDRHLLLMDGVMRLGAGPRENMVRPAIDPLFRSAALTYRERVVGVVLSGLLNDGAAGLSAIRQCGGLTVVQHPLDAEADQMPRAALETTDVDHVINADGLATLLASLVGEPAAPNGHDCPPDLELEVHIALGQRLGATRLKTIAHPSPITCPHCQGVLSEIEGARPLRYRCQTGHAFTAETLIAAQEPEVDEALRVALRVIEERVTLVGRMAEEARASGRHAVAELYEARTEEYAAYAATLRDAAIHSLDVQRDTPPEV